ncbi:MAG TPA: hypothetical protein VKZ53_18760 [Candidatus Angelobacter sp.]|nr:hypothetical protein [Candidatus Angelobacter sp.]
MRREIALQRLFSTFANGMPGLGLMIQRFVIATVLVYRVIEPLPATSQFASTTLQLVDAGSAILLLVGLWTPLAGVIVAARGLWIALSGGSDPWMALVLATLGATLAMIGPGACSIDARLFGRRQIGGRQVKRLR